MKAMACGGLAAILIVVAGCSNPTDGIQPLDPTRSRVVRPSLDTLFVGATLSLVLARQDSSASVTRDSITWTVSDSRVAVIDQPGQWLVRVRAVHEGTATVTAASGTSTASMVLTVTGTQLVFTQLPATTTAGAAFAPAVMVTIADVSGHAVASATTAVTVALDSNPTGGALLGTTTVSAVHGIATFTDLSIQKAGPYWLRATAAGSRHKRSAMFMISAAEPTRLTFLAQPVTTENTFPIAPAVLVAVQDAFANRVMTATNAVTIALGSNPSGGTLSGTTTVTPAGGTAAFADLTIDRVGTGYTLTATADGLTGATSVAFDIRAMLVFATVSAGGSTTCALTAAGDAYCWGNNGNGQLGIPITTNNRVCRPNPRGTGVICSPAPNPRPVAVSGALSLADITTGGLHTCGLTAAGVAYCWGYNAYGQLGNGTLSQSTTPAAVTGALDFSAIAAGGMYSCALTAAGAAYCWGSNTMGQLGNPPPMPFSSTPVPVSGGLVFASLSTGFDHACGLTASGDAYCWGSNNSGQLGAATTESCPAAPPPGLCSTTPVAVSGGIGFTRLIAGNGHTCGLTAAGAAYCWGDNAYGQLGDGTTTSSATPVAVSGGFSFASVSAGLHSACAVTSGGAAYCWGAFPLGNGDGSGTNSATPVAVSGGLAFAAVSVGAGHTCSITSTGAAYCWGANAYGQLGTGNTAWSNVPVHVIQ